MLEVIDRAEKHLESVDSEVAAIHEAQEAAEDITLGESMGVRYNMDPFSLSGSNQHIQLPEDVMENQSGLCIETSLVIASALQSAKMHVFLIFPPGHAQVAVEVTTRGFWD